MKVHRASLWNRDQWQFIAVWRNLLSVRRIRAPWRCEHFWIVSVLGNVWFIEWGAPGIDPAELLKGPP